MTAQVDFSAGRKPAQVVVVAFFDSKRSFGQIILARNVQHHILRQPFIHNADSCRIPSKHLFCKRIYNVLFHLFPSRMSTVSIRGPPASVVTLAVLTLLIIPTQSNRNDTGRTVSDIQNS